MRILITAGPTREYIDAVRYISNPSSGKMGFALARAAQQRQHKTVLITGPVNLAVPTRPDNIGTRTKVINVTTSREMRKEVLRYFMKSDCLIMAAAVSDYRSKQTFKHKIKKNKKTLTLKLVRNPDILKEVARVKDRSRLCRDKRIVIGFALETENFLPNALKKLKNKKLDYIVLNTPASFGRDKINASIFNHSGCLKQFKNISKNKLSEFIIKLAENTGSRR